MTSPGPDDVAGRVPHSRRAGRAELDQHPLPGGQLLQVLSITEARVAEPLVPVDEGFVVPADRVVLIRRERVEVGGGHDTAKSGLRHPSALRRPTSDLTARRWRGP